MAEDIFRVSENTHPDVAGRSFNLVNPKFVKPEVPQKKCCRTNLVIGRKSQCSKGHQVPPNRVRLRKCGAIVVLVPREHVKYVFTSLGVSKLVKLNTWHIN